MEREDISSLYERIEKMKKEDPRSRGTPDEVTSLYIEIEKIIRDAGWGVWEYYGTICYAM